MTTGQGTRVIQVTNVAKAATNEQLRTFFEFLGEIEELKVFPSQDLTSFGSKVCYIKYQDESSVHVAQHLTNTVFIDRALIVVPLGDGIIPEEHQVLQVVAPAVVGNYVGGLIPAIPGIVQTVIGSVMPVVRMQLTVPQPPPLPDTDPIKVDEIRRTVHIRHLPKDITAEQLMSFFSACGEIRYVRIAGDDEETRYAFIEFNEASCVGRALQYNGALFGGIPLKVGYSKHAIAKPEKEIARTKSLFEKTMKKVTDASKLVSDEIDEETTKSRKGSRSRSPSRGRRSTSRSRSGRRRSRSRSSDRYSRQRRRRSPSRERYNRDRRRPSRTSRSRSRDRKRRRSTSRGRSKDRTRRRSRDRSRDRGKDKPKESSRKKTEKKETKSPEKKKEGDGARSDKDEGEKEDVEKQTSKKKEEKPREKSRSRSRSKSQQREKKKPRDKSPSRSTSRSPKRTSSKHKKKRERRHRASDDDYDEKKRSRESEDEGQSKVNRADESDEDHKKSRRRRSDDESDPDESKKKKRHYKKKPISAENYDSDSA